MYTTYLACDLGTEEGRVSLGTLNKGRLNVSTMRQFPNERTREGSELQWDIPNLFHHLTESLTEVARTDETVNGVSCSSWGEDYLLFDAKGNLLTPVCAPPSDRLAKSMDTLLSRISREDLYEETGVQPTSHSTLIQLGAEKSKRLSKASYLMPVADGFNYLLSGEPRVEASSASPTQLFNPLNREWSLRMLEAIQFPSKILPPVVSAGTYLGPLRQEIATQTGIEDVDVVTSCSNEMAATLAGVPAHAGMSWAYLQMGTHSSIGTELPYPVLNEASLKQGFTNESGCAGTVRLSKPTVGRWILDECQRYWTERGQELDWEMMMHLASVSSPLESLIDPTATHFLTPGDMPHKIKAFCRESGQPIPRKPGAIVRCILESVALYFRRNIQEMETVTGRKIDQLYLLEGGARHPLFNNFIANALQIPVVICPAETTATGNILMQAIALKHVESIEAARDLSRASLRCETVLPYSGVWDQAFEKMEQLTK